VAPHHGPRMPLGHQRVHSAMKGTGLSLKPVASVVPSQKWAQFPHLGHPQQEVPGKQKQASDEWPRIPTPASDALLGRKAPKGQGNGRKGRRVLCQSGHVCPLGQQPVPYPPIPALSPSAPPAPATHPEATECPRAVWLFLACPLPCLCLGCTKSPH
jgi:hypothetical protein